MAEQENVGNAEALMLNSKRQRRPSVRLGEIGDFPVAFTIDRPLKQRKKRRVPPPEAPPMFEPLLGEDQLLMDVDMDADVDMTGFNLDDSGAGSPWDNNSSRVQRTRPLEHVSNESPPATAAAAAVAAPEEAAAELEAQAEAAGPEAAASSKGKQKDEQQNEGSFMDDGVGEATVQAEEPARSVENEGEQREQQQEQQEQPKENGNLEQEQEQEAEAEAEGEQDAVPEKQQQSNGVVKKGRSRTPKAKYGRRKKSTSSRASAASQRAKRSAAEAARRANRNAVESGASEGECDGDTTKEEDDKEQEDDGKEELRNEKAEEHGGKDKQEAAEKQSAAAAPPTHRVTRGSKSLPKDAECPSKSQQSSKVEKNLRSSRSRQLPPPPPSTAKDSKGDEPDSSGDDEHHQQQQTQEQREQDADHHHHPQQQQQLQQKQPKQKQQQRKQQQENGTLGDNSSGDTGAVKEQAEQEHESFVLPGYVKKWLYERRLGKYVELFEFHEVDEEVLPLLTMDDLRDMGIIAIGARRKMFQAIQELG